MVLLSEKAITFYNVNNTQAKQRWYVIGGGCVNRDGPTHTVSDDHDGRWVLSIENLHHFANIPLERKSENKLLTLIPNSLCFKVLSTDLQTYRTIPVYNVWVSM